MSLISLENVSVHYGDRAVLDGVTFSLERGEKVALVGANGCGKTTLLHVLAGSVGVDSGTATRQRGVGVGVLEQEPSFEGGHTLFEELLNACGHLLEMEEEIEGLGHALAEASGDDLEKALSRLGELQHRYEEAGGYTYEAKIRAVLMGLGFTEEEMELPPRLLSGGQKSRAALARLLVVEPDVMLLDEPTNHLDMSAVEWLEEFLAGYKGACLFVSHDRFFIDRVADRTVAMWAGGLRNYPGGYTQYLSMRKLEMRQQRDAYEGQQAEIARLQEYIRRNIFGQKSKQAKSRMKELERMQLVEPPRTDAELSGVSLGDVVRSGDDVLFAEGVSKAYPGKELFSDLSFYVRRADRLGIVGDNGTGKTTLLRILLDQLAPDAGLVRWGSKVSTGYYAQAEDAGSSGVVGGSVLSAVRSSRPDLNPEQARAMLGRFLFSGDEVDKSVGVLSGGELARLRLCMLVLSRANCLLMDEPTNHLDIPARDALESALAEYRGTLVVVSHDRYFLDRLVDRLLVLRDGEVRMYLGNYSYYLGKRAEARAAREARQQSARRADKKRRAAGRRAAAKSGSGRKSKAKSVAAPEPPPPRPVAELEALIAEAEAGLSVRAQTLANAETYQDPERMRRLRAEYEELHRRLTELMSEWERAAGGA